MGKFQKMALLSALIAGSLIPSLATANVVQYFGFQTDNPAALQFIKANEIQVGGALVMPRLKQEGTALNVQGDTVNGVSNGYQRTDPAFPQLRYAHRFSEKFVASIDVSEPVAGFYTFSKDSFAATAGYDIGVRSVSIVPKASFAINDTFTVGAAFVATNIYNFDMNFLTPGGYFENRDMNGWAYGFQLGAMYKLNDKTFVDLTYLSKVNTAIRGESFAGSLYSSNAYLNDYIWTPKTFAGRAIRFMTQEWLSVLEVDFSKWSDQQTLNLYNTALSPNQPLITPIYYNDTWRFSWYNHYQVNKQWGAFGLIIYDGNPQSDPTKNYATLPVSAWTTAVLGFDYKPNDNLKMTLFAGDCMFTPIAHTLLPPNYDVRTTGNWYFVGANFTMNWE